MTTESDKTRNILTPHHWIADSILSSPIFYRVKYGRTKNKEDNNSKARHEITNRCRKPIHETRHEKRTEFRADDDRISKQFIHKHNEMHREGLRESVILTLTKVNSHLGTALSKRFEIQGRVRINGAWANLTFRPDARPITAKPWAGSTPWIFGRKWPDGYHRSGV